jgi:cell division protein FtsL
MIVTAKKGQKIQQGLRIRISRPSSPAFTLPRQRPNSSDGDLSERLYRLLFRSLFVLFVTVFILALLLRWSIQQEQVVLDELLTAQAQIRQEHAALMEERDQLRTRSRIAAAAAVRLGLYLPEKNQEHLLY